MSTPELHFERKHETALNDLGSINIQPDACMDALVQIARDLFKVDGAFISLVGQDHQWLKARTGIEIIDTAQEFSFCAHAIQQAPEVLIVPDACNDDRFSDNPLVTGAPHIRFYAGYPLTGITGLPIGALCLVHSSPRTLDKREQDRLHNLAKLAEGFLRMTSLDKQVRALREALVREQRKALIDPLTLVWNRAALEHLYPGESALARHNHECMAVLFIDLDHFKQINDAYGHVMGDQVLVEAAQRITSSLRAQDILMRFGGEEFVVLTRIKNKEMLELVAERIRSELCQHPVYTTGAQIRITASIGGVTGSSDAVVEQLLATADTALYEAKRGGRNRSVIY